MTRAELTDPAVIYAEILTPRGDHRVCDYRIQIAIPLDRMPDGISDDMRAVALREMCQKNGISLTYTLSPNDDLGCPIYDCTLTVENLREG